MSEPERTMTEAITDSITEAACVVADLTHARPSVYFEVGYAHGLGVPLLLTCRKDHHRGTEDNARVHFDLQQYRISFWERTSESAFSWDKKSMKPDKRLAALVLPREPES
jgi:nucleoside 2-deoxyribosyltransferase